jgi:hypothetical protein
VCRKQEVKEVKVKEVKAKEAKEVKAKEAKNKVCVLPLLSLSYLSPT